MNQCSVDIGVGASSLDFQDRRVPWTSSGIVILKRKHATNPMQEF
jgi:hypothetical protein